MEDIIAPINRELLKSELTAERRLRSTNKSHNEIYIVNWKNAPNVLKEIGRLREIAFRAAGGGTGPVPRHVLRTVPHPVPAVRTSCPLHPELRFYLSCYPAVRWDGRGAGSRAVLYQSNQKAALFRAYRRYGAGGGRERDPGLVAAAGCGEGRGQAGRTARPAPGRTFDPGLPQGSPVKAGV